MGWNQAKARLLIDQAHQVDAAKMALCGSPIEALFLAAWLFTYPGDRIIPQHRVSPYTLDFLALDEKDRGMAVECDGWEFHGADPVRYRADRKRDRVLLTKGLITMRFMGTEIVADPYDCVGQVGKILGLQRNVASPVETIFYES